MGAAGSSGQHVPRPTMLPAAPMGLEWQTAASGSCDRPNLQTLQQLAQRIPDRGERLAVQLEIITSPVMPTKNWTTVRVLLC
ncbi:hypothetical protein UY3_08656 [Chelonia mydas]|uniref:Uncharacterized protein n=1 Tax=Chelonia mydas TaxID=8469 RepID=M7BQ40_CHEMY|nr:hypothetical protein UY3_08656 [Chelonia mydas]